MRDNFRLCLQFILYGRDSYKGEGGFIHAAHDPGGYTNKGITLATLSRYLNRPATVSELRTLSDTLAGNIYKTKYWDTIGGDDLPRGLDLLTFDISVNSGSGQARILLSRAGDGTPVERIHALDKQRLGFWRHLRNWPYFARGWTARENACLAYALGMAGETT